MINKYIKEICIGNVKLKNNVLLAPMAGVTDVNFRYICNRYNPGAMETEMVSAKGLVYKDEKTQKILDTFDTEYPRIIQIFGSDEEILKQAVLKLNEMDTVDIIDFNLGCPAPKITKNGDGAALLKDLNKVENIIKAIMSVATKPVMVKTRVGYNKGTITAIDVAKLCEKYGVAAITIHGRTKEDYYTGTVDLDTIKKVKESVDILVIGNGDIVDVLSAEKMFEYTGVDAIMIGRASLGAPWIIEEMLTGINKNISNTERLNIIKEHIDLAVKYQGEKTAIPKMRKHIAWYLKGLKYSSEIKNLINKETNKVEIFRLLEKYFSDLKD